MLYYSHVNEDNRIERQLLQVSAATTVVAVAGSGERVIALLDQDMCKEVHAVDINQEALFLLELKLTALKALPVEDYLGFCGHAIVGNGRRATWFDHFKTNLSAPALEYWEKNRSLIKKGIAYTGHFEKFLQRIRPAIRLFLGKNFQYAFAEANDVAIKFPSKKWKLLSRIFSIRWIYRLWGNRDVAFIHPDSATAHIPRALNDVIYSGRAGSCFMTHLIFKGNLRGMKETDLPPSLQKAVLENIRRRLSSGSVHLSYHHLDALDFVNKQVGMMQQPVFYSLSDIPSFETNQYLLQLINKTAVPGNAVVWRTFLRNRVNGNSETLFPGRAIKEFSAHESTRMYQVFAVQNPVL